jgi:hypothetical protein
MFQTIEPNIGRANIGNAVVWLEGEDVSEEFRENKSV